MVGLFASTSMYAQGCPTPVNYRLVQVTPDGVKVAWDSTMVDTSSYANNYIVQWRQLGSVSWSNGVTNQTTYQVTGLTQGVRYEVQAGIACANSRPTYTGSFEFTPMEPLANPSPIFVENYPNQILNDYAPVISLDNDCGGRVLLNMNAAYTVFGYEAGDRVMLIQMQESFKQNTINAFPPANYGTFSTNNANQLFSGNYQILTVAQVIINANNTITLRFTNDITVPFEIAPAGRVQVVRLLSPSFTNTLTIATNVIDNTVSNDSKLLAVQALPWNGLIGGVIGIDANNAGESLVLSTGLNADRAGLRGAQEAQQTNLTECTGNSILQAQNAASRCAPKGEGIMFPAFNGANWATPTSWMGRGRWLNAGGGGNAHNSGGGGGSNISSGGGFGGYRLLPAGCQPPIIPDNGPIGDQNGIPGAPLAVLNNGNRIIAGGGGGAGHANRVQANQSNGIFNNSGLSRGGNGGGIIFIRTQNLQLSIDVNQFLPVDIYNVLTFPIIRLTANGETPPISNTQRRITDINQSFAIPVGENGPSEGLLVLDGAGGGGGGGTIVLDVPNTQNAISDLTGGLRCYANGGVGGSLINASQWAQGATNPVPNCHGAGGGGGGGRILIPQIPAINLGVQTFSLNGGGNGGIFQINPQGIAVPLTNGCLGSGNGATAGAPGAINGPAISSTGQRPCFANNQIILPATAATLIFQNGNNSTINAGVYVLLPGQTFTINQNITLNNVEIIAFQNSTIIVQPGTILTLRNSNLHGCCYLWNGIRAMGDNNSTGKVIVLRTTIADAVDALACNASIMGNNNVFPIFSIDGSILTRNIRHIVLQNIDVNTQNPSPVVMSVERTKFTCPQALLPHISPFFLTPPANRTSYGIFAQGVRGTIHVGTNGNNGNKNLFTDMQFAVFGTQVHKINMRYSEFLNLSFIPLGTDILHIGVNVRGSKELNIRDCLFQNINGNGIIGSAAGSGTQPFEGIYQNILRQCTNGIQMRDGFNAPISIRENRLFNITNIGIECFNNWAILDPNIGYSASTIQIVSNQINSSTTAIRASANTNSFVYIDGNIINTARGIWYDGLNNRNNDLTQESISGNTLTNIFSTGMGITLSGMYVGEVIGNRLTGSNALEGISVRTSTRTRIDENRILDGFQRGISITAPAGNAGNTYSCNRIFNTQDAVHCIGQNLFSGLYGNLFQNYSRAGIYLDASGVLGPQGMQSAFDRDGVVHDNIWGPTNGAWHTFSNSSNGNFSPIFYRAPDNFNGGNYPNGSTYNPGIAGVDPPSDCTPNCPIPNTLNEPPINPIVWTNCLQSNSFVGGGNGNGNPNGRLSGLERAVATGSVSFPYLNVENRLFARKALFRRLLQEPALFEEPEGDTLQAFLNSYATTEGAKLVWTEDLSAINPQTALQLNASVSPTAEMETYEKSYNQVFLPNFIANQTATDTLPVSFSAADKAILLGIANHCPLIGGPAVIKARTLLAGMGYKAWDFIDNCPPTSINGSENGARIGMSVEEQETTRLSMYPNPAKDRFSVAQVGEAKPLSITVINAQGQEVYKNTTTATLTEIPTSTWAAGIYVVRLTIEQQSERVYKLVINR